MVSQIKSPVIIGTELEVNEDNGVVEVLNGRVLGKQNIALLKVIVAKDCGRATTLKEGLQPLEL